MSLVSSEASSWFLSCVQCPVTTARAGAEHWVWTVSAERVQRHSEQWAGPAADSQQSGPGRGNNIGEGQMGGGKWKQWCLVCILVIGRISIGFPECFANFLRSFIQDIAWKMMFWHTSRNFKIIDSLTVMWYCHYTHTVSKDLLVAY